MTFFKNLQLNTAKTFMFLGEGHNLLLNPRLFVKCFSPWLASDAAEPFSK